MNNCFCCHTKLLRHLKRDRVVWFCPTCYREMPSVDTVLSTASSKKSRVKSHKGDSVR